jgi:mRNA interferase YafQ
MVIVEGSGSVTSSHWLLIWEQHDQELILVMLNTGTHADLFDKRYRR